MSAQVVESRRQHLEDYLKALVLGRDERVATCKELSTFLESDAEAVRVCGNVAGCFYDESLVVFWGGVAD